MKLGILCTMTNGFGKRGFYNSQEIGLGRALAGRGHTVTVYKGVPYGEPAEVCEPGENLVVRYIPLRHIGAHGWLRCSVLDGDMDGLLCFSDQQQFLPHVYRFCRRRGIVFVPYVGTTHSVYENLHGHIMNWLFRLGTLRLYRRMPVLAKTEAALWELRRLGVKSEIRVTPVGLDETALKSDFRQVDREALRREYGYAPEDVVLLCIAKLEDYKRPLDLLEILRDVRDKKRFRLLIVGRGPLREAMEERTREYGLEERVRIIDQVAFPDIWKLYVLADYFVNTNREEIFGMAIMEAVYYETSVAAFAGLGPSVTLRGLSGHRLCGSLAEIEEWITAEPPSAEALSRDAGILRERFSWEHTAAAFCELTEAELNGTELSGAQRRDRM